MKYLNVYLIYSLTFYVTLSSLFFPASRQAENANDHSSSLCTAATAFSSAQNIDSLALVSLYNATNGWLWTNRWNLSSPVSTWYGISLDTEGYVDEIHLNNNRLSGTLPPDIGNLSRLRYLQVDNNNIGGNIPDEIGQLSNLTILFIDDNDFSGEIPDALSNCSMLMTVFMDNNRLSGAIPPGFTSLYNLQTLDIFNNRFDSLPDLSGLNLQFNKFRVYNNRFTFDDIVPNLGNAMNNRYPPQDSVFEKGRANVPTGTYFEIDLGIDENITDNVYQWYKDGLPYGAPGNSNTLTFNAIDWSDAGTYRCDIDNPRASLLTLHSRSFTINVVCGSSRLEVRETLCAGESIMVNAELYNHLNTSGLQILPGLDRYGCDSIIDVQIQVLPEAIGLYTATLCSDESLVINGNTYDRNRPTGIEFFSGGSVNGCDSSLTIQLDFYPEIRTDFNPVLCSGESVLINGSSYDEGRPAGTEILIAGAANGCDSIVDISLNFNSPALHQIDQQICEGSSLSVNGTIYDQSNPSGSEVFAGAAANGCDSIVNINLSFSSAVVHQIDQQLCEGSSLSVNGTVYDQNNPSGSEVFAGAAINGCDSIVNINLSFSSAVVHQIDQQLCEGSSLSVNGTVYDQNNPSGSEVFAGAAANGCDSIVNINLSFSSAVVHQIDQQLCEGSSLSVNGTVYDQSNPSGSEVFAGAAANGCDSIVNINLSFSSAVVHQIDQQLCEGSSLSVNGTVYDQNNPSGSEVFAGAAANGCDSIVNINLSFSSAIVHQIDQQLCEGSSLSVNGTVYDQSNPSGSEIFPAGAANGCDSIVNINLSFSSAVVHQIDQQLCQGSSLSVNGTVYDQSNPSGSEIFPAGAANGCDSIVNINLSFSNAVEHSLEEWLCSGAELVVNGSIYNENNPSGSELLTTARGCDSIVLVTLQFYPPATTTISPRLCDGESFLFNGQVYDQDSPSGTQVLNGASRNGCDSIVSIELEFIVPTASSFSQTLCDGAQLRIGNEVFDQSRPGGTVVLEGMGQYGCDSTVVVDLNFRPPAEGILPLSVCPGESIDYNGTLYDENNRSGQEILPAAAVNGCDSVVLVELQILPPATARLEQTLCEGSEMMVNGTRYDMGNPSGTEVFVGAAANGCDSILTIDLDFMGFVTTDLNLDLCEGEAIEVNGNLYNQSNPSGTEVFSGGSVNGCDSIVNIQLNFMTAVISQLSPELCAGDVLVINGNLYNESNPSGTEVLTGAAVNGCDSIIQVNLRFNTNSVYELSETLCPGEQILVNGNWYDQNQASGLEILSNASSSGCDSVIRVELTFLQPVIRQIRDTLCSGEQLFVNGQIYDQNRPAGVETLSGAAANGCDSVLQIDLQFATPTEGYLQLQLCHGESFTLNGQVYDDTNPAGTEVLSGMNQLGCDSLVHIDLQFLPPATYSFADTICLGETYLFEGQSLQTGGTHEVLLANASAGGCDSTVQVRLFVQDPVLLPEARAGANEIVCSDISFLGGNLPPGSTGLWESLSGVDLIDPEDPASRVEGLRSGESVFVWSLSTGHCTDYDRDTVTLTLEPEPLAVDDHYEFLSTDGPSYLDILDNDELAGEWYFNLLLPPVQGTLEEEANGNFRFRWPANFSGSLDFTYELCQDLCPDRCSQAKVSILIEAPIVEEEIIDIPNGFTPNGDGTNEFFVIPALEEHPGQYPDAELIIFSRWGDIIYQAIPYQNDWDGRDRHGKLLPTGTYYYLLKLDIAEGDIYKGDVTILK